MTIIQNEHQLAMIKEKVILFKEQIILDRLKK
jgi:hypothetical protein